jgi:hypothetical protein
VLADILTIMKVRYVMSLSRQEVGLSLKRLRKQRREVVEVRALACHPDDLARLEEIMEWIQYLEKERRAMLMKCPH